MNIINRCIVSYKEKVKGFDKFNCILAKITIVKDVLFSKLTNVEIAKKHGLHRNTVANIMNQFTKMPYESQKALRQGEVFNREEVLKKFIIFAHKSRAPLTNKRMATPSQEKEICKLHENLGYGPKRIIKDIIRTLDKADNRSKKVKDYKKVKNLTLAQIKGIFKRKQLRPKKRKTGSNQSIRLYNYETLGAFEKFHYDTKTITDLKALPLDIYNKFKNNPELPVIEWNIIDAATRFRFMAYSHSRTSEFGFHFLICVLQFIRGSFPCRRDIPISIGMDNGAEFCLGSKDKLDDWNRSLAFLNASAWAYNPKWDIRKNLIERSHRTDDEEFFVPKGYLFKGKNSFLKEAKNYFIFFNSERTHSGHGMNGMTPLEKLISKGFKSAEKLLYFPIMLLEDTIGEIKKNSEVVLVLDAINAILKKGKSSVQKKLAELSTIYSNFFSQPCAQNVLTYYQSMITLH